MDPHSQLDKWVIWLTKKEILMACPRNEVELPEKENLIDDAGNKKVNRIPK